MSAWGWVGAAAAAVELWWWWWGGGVRDGVWWDKTRVMTREDKHAWRLWVKRSIMRSRPSDERLHGGSTFHRTELAWWRRSSEGRSGALGAAEGTDVAPRRSWRRVEESEVG